MKILKHRKYLHDPEGNRLPVKLAVIGHKMKQIDRAGNAGAKSLACV